MAYNNFQRKHNGAAPLNHGFKIGGITFPDEEEYLHFHLAVLNSCTICFENNVDYQCSMWGYNKVEFRASQLYRKLKVRVYGEDKSSICEHVPKGHELNSLKRSVETLQKMFPNL